MVNKMNNSDFRIKPVSSIKQRQYYSQQYRQNYENWKNEHVSETTDTICVNFSEEVPKPAPISRKQEDQVFIFGVFLSFITGCVIGSLFFSL